MRKCTTFVLSVFSFTALAAVDVDKLSQALAQKSATWKARSNWVTQLDEAGLKKLMGAPRPQRSLDYSDVYSLGMSAETVDWRDRDGMNWLGPVMNQGNCGSCVAFAAIATLEAQLSINAGVPWLKPQLSTQALFACGGGSCERGWYPDTAVNYMRSKGVVDASCAPYTMGSDGKDVACRQFCPDQAQRTLPVRGSFSQRGAGWFGSAAKVKEALKKGPLMTTMTVYEDFSAYAGGVYKTTSRRSVGGHAVSLVGYSDEGRYWIIRNSWGEDWGERGYARISWDDTSGIGSENLGFTGPVAEAQLAILSPSENEYVSGELRVSAGESRSLATTFELRRQGQLLRSINRSDVIDTRELTDGRYELVAVDGASGVRSLVRGFTVLNTPGTANITLAPFEFDASRPINRRVEFLLDINSTPVALQSLEFLVFDSSGAQVARRSYDTVLPKMKLGFRFNTLPAGDYSVVARGHLSGQVFNSAPLAVRVGE